MEKLDIVITMAGLGSRFRKAGYRAPKYMIEAHGKTLFEWAMLSLEGFREKAEQYIFIVRKEDCAENFIQDKCTALGIRRFQVIEIDHLTDGQATTAMSASSKWNLDNGLLLYNIDTYVEPYCMSWEELRGDGFMPCFKGTGEHWSFVRVDGDKKAVEVAEKKRISDFCTVGAYYFKSARLYEKFYKEFYLSDQGSNGQEKYVAPIYQYMIEKGKSVYISNIPVQAVHVLGTPEELRTFLEEGKELSTN